MEMHSSQTCLITVVQDLHSTVFGIRKDNLKVLPYLNIRNANAFKAFQKIIEVWTKKSEWKELKRAEAVIETTRNIMMQDFRAV